jgi:hypothetical protein
VKPANCLDLDPHDGDIELIEALELEFGFVPTQEKVGGWLTLGDVHNTLQAEIAIQGEGACPSLRAFNLLRAALMAGGLSRASLRTDTALDALAEGRPRQWLKLLGKHTGLEMPSSRTGALGVMSVVCWFMGWLVGCITAINGNLQTALMYSLPFIAIAAILFWLDKGQWPAGIVTLGDLVDRVAGLNHNRLGDVRDLKDSTWRRLTAIVAEQSDTLPAEMKSDTLLFAPRKTLRERISSR